MTGGALYFTEPRSVAIRDRPRPTPGSDELLVETRVSAISAGTELLVYRGQAPRNAPADETIDALSGTLEYPLQYGYAAVGDVAAVGEDVDPSWRNRTVFAFQPHQRSFAVAPENVVVVPEGVDPERAALLPSVETAVNFALDGTPRIGERVAVFGQGVVGLLTTAVLASFPLAELLAVEPIRRRRDLAARFGADRTLAPDGEATPVPADGGGDGDGDDPPGYDLVYELSGDPATLNRAVTVTGYDGRIVVGSWYGRKRAPIDLGNHFHRDRIAIESSQVSTISPELRGRWSTDRRMDVAWDHLQALGDVDLVSHRIPFAEAPRAYELLDTQPEKTLQVLLTYD